MELGCPSSSLHVVKQFPTLPAAWSVPSVDRNCRTSGPSFPFMSNTTPAMPDLPRPEDVVITSDAWAQIMSHAPMTEERRARDRQSAAQQQRGVEDLLREGSYPTTPLRFVKRIAPPSPGMEIVDTFT